MNKRSEEFKYDIILNFFYKGLMNRFLREEVALESKPLDRERKLKQFVSDPKVLSKILCGI
jgi:hypothetical protein